MSNAEIAGPAAIDPHAYVSATRSTPRAVGRVRMRNALSSVLVGTTWDHDAFRDYVIDRAKILGIADSTATLSRETKIPHSMLSKWFRGEDRPSPASIRKLAAALVVEDAEGRRVSPATDLLVLAGYTHAHEVGMADPPSAPAGVEQHPLVRELGKMLSPDSHLSAEDRDLLAAMVDKILAGWRRPGRRRTA